MKHLFPSFLLNEKLVDSPWIRSYNPPALAANLKRLHNRSDPFAASILSQVNSSLEKQVKFSIYHFLKGLLRGRLNDDQLCELRASPLKFSLGNREKINFTEFY